MNESICPNCGGNEFTYKDGLKICTYCDSKFRIKEEVGNGISMQKDIEHLLNKCRSDPRHAYKYANLILDIDPENKEAKKFYIIIKEE